MKKVPALPELEGFDLIEFPRLFFNFSSAATYPSGKGELCKSFIQRFESACRLHFPAKRPNA
jgi:hypothetical protein